MISEFKVAVFPIFEGKNLLPKRIFFRFVFTQTSCLLLLGLMTVLAIAGNFFLFIEVLERFQVAYGTFWIELFLACHRTFGILLIRAGK